MTLAVNCRRAVALILASGLASLAGAAGATHVHAQLASACEAHTTWTIGNSLTTSSVAGQVVIDGQCVSVGASGDLFRPLSVQDQTGPLTYQYQGTCVEGVMSFTDGDTAIFLAGIVVWQRQSGGGVLAVVGVAVPSAAPCLGAPQSTTTWSGVIAAAGA